MIEVQRWTRRSIVWLINKLSGWCSYCLVMLHRSLLSRVSVVLRSKNTADGQSRQRVVNCFDWLIDLVPVFDLLSKTTTIINPSPYSRVKWWLPYFFAAKKCKLSIAIGSAGVGSTFTFHAGRMKLARAWKRVPRLTLSLWCKIGVLAAIICLFLIVPISLFPRGPLDRDESAEHQHEQRILAKKSNLNVGHQQEPKDNQVWFFTRVCCFGKKNLFDELLICKIVALLM